MLSKAGTKFFLIYFLHFFYNTENQPDLQCKRDTDCNNPVKCAYCSKGKCNIIDKNIFKNHLPCAYNLTHCQGDMGMNELIKYEGYGECVSVCTTNYYGKKCQYYIGPQFKDGKLTSFLYAALIFITPPVVRFNQPVPVLVIFYVRYVVDAFLPIVIVQDLAGGYRAQLKGNYNNDWGMAQCKDFFKDYEYLMSGLCEFFFVKMSRYGLVYTTRFTISIDFLKMLDTEYTNHTREIQLNIFHPKNLKQLSEYKHYYLVTFPMSTPIIRFTGCGKNIESIKIYKYTDWIYLIAKVFYVSAENYSQYSLITWPELGVHQNLEFKWEAYRVEGGKSQSQIINDYHHKTLWWDIKPRHWFGIYVIKLIVTGYFHLWDEKIKPESKKDFISKQCFLKVEFSPLVAIITGGSTRFVLKERGLKLDASNSRNPNSPDDKSDMEFTFMCNWTKEAVCHPHTIDGRNKPELIIKPMTLESKRSYNFTLKVSLKTNKNLKPAFASQIIVVGELEKGKPYLEDFRVECVYNCETKTNYKDIVYLRVGGPWTSLHLLSFEWVQYKSGENEAQKVEPIRQKNTPSYILIINEDSLKENSKYEIKVSCRNSSQFLVYTLVTTMSSTQTCIIVPQSGEVGVTKFNLTCLQSDSTKTFEFYDKHETDEPDFSGRMIALQETGNIEEFVLTRGKLEILLFDEYGMSSTVTLTTKLSRSNRTTADIKQILDSLIQLSDVYGVEESLKIASVVSDTLTSALKDKETSSSDILKTLVNYLSSLSLKKYHYVKLGISTLHLVLVAAHGSLSLDSAWHAARTLHDLADTLSIGLKEGHLCTFRVLYQIFRRLLDCLYIVLDVKEKYVGQQYINPEIYTRGKEISKYIMKTSFLLQSALSYRHLPAQKQKFLESSLGNLSMWIKVDLPMALSKYTQEEYRTKRFPAIIPDNLAEDVKKMGFFIGLQILFFRSNPTWIKRTNTGEKFDVSICFKNNYDQTCKYPKTLKNGIRVAFDIVDLTSQLEYINVTLKRVDNRLKTDELDLKLPIYKLDPLPLSNVEAHFRFSSNDTELLVLVKRNVRPTYELLVKENYTVTPSNPMYPVVTDPYVKPQLYYLAIQPGAQVKVNESISFKMKIYSKMCYSWHNQWKTMGCWSVPDADSGVLICECNRLSLIGGLVKEVVYALEVVADFPLFLTIDRANAVKVVSLPILMIIFLLLFLICRRADRHGKAKRFVSILPDNYPGDSFGFLVQVVTGARIGAGTNAAVGLKIYGKINNGRNHILSNESYNVMEGMGEDWFLIFEPPTLGRILGIDLWQDNTGARADWFCESITIYDLYYNNCYFFVVNDWINLSFNRFPQVFLYPTKLSELTSPSRVFFEHIKLGFQLSHLWLASILRHPRDPVSRVDRLAVIMGFILVSTATSIMLISLSDNYIEVDDFSYSLTWLSVEMSIYSCIPAATTAWLLMHMFRRIYKIIFYIEKLEEQITHERKVTRVSFQGDYLFLPSTTVLGGDKNYIHYGRKHEQPHETRPKRTLAEVINMSLMPNPLVPVQIRGDEPNVVINKMWFLITWASVIGIVIICITVSIKLSQNMPYLKTLKWFTIVGFTMILHVFFLIPLKITLVSALLAVGFKRIIYKDVYSFDHRDGIQLERFGEIEYLSNLLYLRSQKHYHELSEVFREEHRQNMLRARRWRMLYELFVQIMFLVVLGSLLKTHIPKINQSNAHLKILMKDFYKVFNTTDLKYFQHDYEDIFFKYIWYNWKILSQESEQESFRKDWIYDSVNRVMGKLYLRQFRVKPGYCKDLLNHSIDCAAPFSLVAEDTRDYLPYWINPEDSLKKDKQFGIQYLGKWSFLRPSNDSNFFFNGITGHTYPSGGYRWDLKASHVEMDASLIRLWEEGWIGHYTRAVLLQVKMYNVNTRLFSEIVLIAEQSIAGQIIPTTIVHSVDINIQLDWWLTIFIFLVFMTCVRVFVLINFVGVLGMFKNWRRPYEMLMALNGLAVIYYILLHFLTVPKYIKEYQLHSDDLQFFDFYKTAHYIYTSRALLCALYFLNLMRFFSLWRFGKSVYRILLLIKHSIKHVIWLLVIFVFLEVLLFRIIGYLFLIFIDVVFSPNLVYRYSHLSMGKEMDEGFKILRFTMSFSSTMIMIFLIIILAHEYKIARIELIRHWNIDNYFMFIYNEIVAIVKNASPSTTKVATIFQKRHETNKNVL